MEFFKYEKTINLKFDELCEEIDYWKYRCLQAEEKVEKLTTDLFESNKYHLDCVNKDIGLLLTMTLNSKINKKGEFVIDSSGREEIINKLEQNQ